MAIPVIDIFAGPGGLGEGFSNLFNSEKERLFKIVLSIEKDINAHKTLSLRSFFRQFDSGKAPDDYYKFLRKEISLKTLYEQWPEQHKKAQDEAWLATLGEGKDAVSNSLVDKKIQSALNGKNDWLLIGGPPCQAYSVAGRNRRQEVLLDESTDERVGLYKQYLRILAIHNPTVFVMENVKGILSAATKESPVFTKILKDLVDPVKAYQSDFKQNGELLECPGYKIYSLVVKPEFDSKGYPILKQKDYVIYCENYGVPQARHRVILLGIRKDLDIVPDILETCEKVNISQVLSGLPRLRGALSKISDSGTAWKKTIVNIKNNNILKEVDEEVRKEIIKQLKFIRLPQKGTGSEFIKSKKIVAKYNSEWFVDLKLNGVCNHKSRGHMESDLIRYFFVSCYAKVKGISPQLKDFPIALLPNHKNVFEKDGTVTSKFPDRFKVQVKNRPSRTITSHISQDGHYFIHYDPSQCRSLTVREAARIQTFPDNYYFCGPRTQQFIQVGNAVPPILASAIARIVSDVFQVIKTNEHENLQLATLR
ncbi:DNA cytosine methyltransferase [Ulvibacterium sp.]|uniref:DNA cytosine methyltransferase n=1 Tax=Ulvibacterium sp. TaxID=2665914 RepID=UPI00260C6333|nr:DNA (cytosine-5-)-methyltransferase [Ulvibacterium sp.]